MEKKTVKRSKSTKETKAKKTISQKKQIKTNSEKFSENDVSLIDKTFNLVKNLNSEVDKIGKVKAKLQKDVIKLSKRVENQNNSSKKPKNDILLNLKEELIKEITPLLNKFNFKSIQVDIFKEIGQIIEIEIAKIKTEINSKNSKTKNEFKKQFSQIEVRIIETLKSNEAIKKEFEKFEKSKIKNLFNNLEKKLSLTLENKQKEILFIFNENSSQIEELKNQLNEQKSNYLKINKNITRFKNEMKNLVSKDNTNLVSITSKIEKLNKEHNAINSLISSFEDKLYSQNIEIENSIQKKIKSDIIKLNKLITDLDLKQKGIEELVFTQAKEVVKSEAIKAIKSDFKNYSNKLEIKFDKLKNEIDNSNENINKSFNEIQIEKEAQENLLINKYNKIIDQINEFENKILNTSDNQIKNIKNKFEKEINKIINKEIKNNQKDKEKFLSEIESKFSKLNLDIHLSINENVEKFSKEKKEIENYFKENKNELLGLIKNYISQVDKEIINLKETHTQIKIDKDFVLNNFSDKTNEISNKLNSALNTIENEKEIERELITKKINEIIDKFETLAIDNKVLFSNEKKLIKEETRNEIKNEFDLIKEEIARFKLENQEFKKKLADSNKEDQIKNSEIIENKIINSTNKFEEEIKLKIISFMDKIDEIESKFEEEIKKQTKEKELVINELKDFELGIKKNTKEFISKIDSEIKVIKSEENIFNEKKEIAIGEFEEFISFKKEELKDFENQIQNKISNLIKEEKTKQEKNDNNFKNLFNEKISNLIESTNNKLNKFETKFIEKNIAKVIKKIEEEKSVLDLINSQLNSKADTISKEIENLDNKQITLFEDLESKENKVKENIEIKLKTIEQQLNKRFLELDAKFTEFKGIVVDEVEDLIKEVHNVISGKVEMIDKHMSKITFLSNETTNKINDFNRITKGFENEMINMRNEISDVRVKTEVMTPEIHSLNDHIHYMQTYEEQLIGLIRNLKNRGLTQDSIQTALINKGHPRFYVSMILKDFEILFN